MNLSVENVLLFALVVCALYFLMNRCGCKEGMKNSGNPENSSDCERLCSERRVGLSIGQQCVYDKDCEKGGIGCKIGGITLCRLCDNDDSTDYPSCAGYLPSPPPPPPPSPPPPSPPPPPPPPPPSPPPSGEKSLQELGITTPVDNKMMFDITILDLDPKKYDSIRYHFIPRLGEWWVNFERGGPTLYDNVKDQRLTLLNNLRKHAGMNSISVYRKKGKFHVYSYNIHFSGSGYIIFWDDTGDNYSMQNYVVANHDLGYDSDRPKLRAFFSDFGAR